MKFRTFLGTWRGLEAQNRWSRWLIGGLLLCNLLQVSVHLMKEVPVIVLPPDLHEEVRISQDKGSSSLKEAWGLFIAELLGNVTPGNSRFIEAALAPLIDPSISPSVMAGLWDQIEAIKADRISLSFKPKGVVYEAETDKVFVSGEQWSQGPNGSPEHHPRTYELEIRFRHYRPNVTAIDVYSDDPRTKDRPPVTPASSTSHSTRKSL